MSEIDQENPDDKEARKQAKREQVLRQQDVANERVALRRQQQAENAQERAVSRQQQDRRSALEAAATSLGPAAAPAAVFERAEAFLDWLKQG